ncbi:MAG: FlgO family outer membrane protein, partial [Desulfovibrionaceae bacterium]
MNIVRPLLLGLLCLGLLSACSTKKQGSMEALPTSPQYMEAQELKLKVRELADQLLATLPNDCLTGLVAMPTSFVNVNNFQQSSTFGRLVAESLIFEFNQRSFPVREYRLPGYIAMRAEQGDFALARQGMVNAQEKWAALLLGTYYRDKDAVFVNARLVRAADGMVLRTAQLLLVNSELVARL